MVKKLNIAIVWHFHQPVYQENYDGDFLMPWVRLHAVKDYLDMLLIAEKFPSLKLNFNFAPSLLSSIDSYTIRAKHDIHSRLTLTPCEKLTKEDKEFILNNFFDANYSNMILHHEEFAKLYAKRFQREDVSINDFTDAEYSDIMALFNLAWMDPVYKKYYPKLVKATNKGKNFTLEDRQLIYDTQLDIMSKIIPTFKKFQDEGKIEILTSPYYHPILPLLIDIKCGEENIGGIKAPACSFSMKADAYNQTKMALDKMEEIFGKRPTGIWPSEQCLSEETLNMFSELGVKWTITDEGLLANSLNKEFIRDFRGNLEDPYALCRSHEFKTDYGKIKIIFRDSFLANLIGFEYGHHDPSIAANDLYERIKVIQDKLKNSPGTHNLLTIAMDGENCWESYIDDGEPFLNAFYKLLENDNTIETVKITDYLEKVRHPEKLKQLKCGSWINRNFSFWIGEPTKNLAWTYLNNARQKLAQVENSLSKEKLEEAYKEIYVAQGSDWYWWYGEPNDSGQDEIFDYLFREHLRNVYKIIGEKSPEYLDVPLIAFIGKPSKYPKKNFTPKICGCEELPACWDNAGCIDIPDSPTFSANKIIKTIYFGNDKNNIYFRFELNKDCIEASKFFASNQIYIYFKRNSSQYKSPIRTVNKTESIFPILREGFSYEAKISYSKNKILNFQLANAMKDGLWHLNILNKSVLAYDSSLEMSVSFDDLNVKPGETIEFFIIDARKSVIEEFFPQDILIDLTRPKA